MDDDWDLSVEEMDSLEKEALERINQQRNSSSSDNRHPQQIHSPNEVQDSSHGTRVLPPTLVPNPVTVSVQQDQCSIEHRQKVSVKFILHASGNIAAKFAFNPLLVDAVRRIPKATWNAKERLWIFPQSSLLSAENILREGSNIRVEVENLDPLVQRAIASASKFPDLRQLYDKIPSHIESQLLPFQREGVKFILQHGGRVLLADEMGLGKTLQAIAVTTCIRDSWPVLVLAPSSLRLQWATMIQQWLHLPPSDIVVVLSQAGGSNKSGFTIVSSTKSSIHLDGVFNIISYDVVPKLERLLMASDFKVVIADESHFLKNAQAKRTNASLPVIKKAQYAILLSGTPALSRPIELFKQLEALYPDVYKNVHEYGNRYCKGGFFGVYQGASNHEELHNLMKGTVMIRRLKKDVLSELPTKRRQQVFLDLGEKELKQINALFRELEAIKAKLKDCTSEDEVQSLKFSQKNLINKIYTDSAEAKISAVLDYLGTVLEAGCKFLVFAHHQSMLDALHQFLKKRKVGCIRIDGSTPASSRQNLVSDFQEKDEIKAAVLSIRAAGVGLTLTAASTVIFAELSWTPGDLIQAEDRAHRIGQDSSVNIYYLLANDTVDDIIWDVVQSKLENLGQMLDGHENALEISSGHETSSLSKLTNSPVKQKTLETFLKRCNSADEDALHSRLKFPRN